MNYQNRYLLRYSCSAFPVSALVLISLWGGSLQAQAVRDAREAIELGVDLGLTHASYSFGAEKTAAPLALRIGWLNEGRRPNLEFQMLLNDRRRPGQESSNTMTSFQIGVRLKKNNAGVVPIAGPFVSVGGGVSSLRRHVSEPDAPRFRFLPSVSVGIGARHPIGSSFLRAELVAGFDRGYAGPESTLFVPSRTSVGIRLGFSALHQ